MARLTEPQTLFGRRLREARNRAGLPQDLLGVLVGIDETASSARISRYETGAHAPAFMVTQSLAKVLKVPAAYFYAEDDFVAEIILRLGRMESDQRQRLLDAAIKILNESEQVESQ